MAAHTERMEKFENAIFKQREEINDRMAEMFGLLKELTTNMAPKKVLIREEAKYPVTKNVNSISLSRGKEENNNEDNATTGDDIEKTSGSYPKMPVKEAEKENEAENGAKNESNKRAEREEVVESPSSQPVGYYLKHRINEKIIQGLGDNNRFNDSLSRVRVGKMKEKTYNLLPRGPVYETILKKKITRKEEIRGNFEIPCNIGDIREDEKRPFILGTPFLATAKAVIKFDKGTITLKYGKSKISFHRIPKSLGKLTNAEIRDLFPKERLMAVSDKNNEPCGPSGGHHGIAMTARKVFEVGFYWLNIFRDARRLIQACDAYFMGPFLSSNGNKYILVAIDYVSKLVEAQAFPANNARNVVNFLKRQFARFGILKAFISDRAKVKVVRTILSKQRHENGAIKVYDEDGNEFIVNQQRVKP
ncbi:MAK10-like protein [Tanacetum coccineum]|uniref:MAK10-like protein n=1 Tax=Tanacetum coccineum TaxID=301880 RepID=A0ABQ5IEW5_9ASTR